MSVEKLSRIVELLRKETNVSPSQIAETIGSDRRTVDKVLNIAEDLNIISCRKLEVSGRIYKTCELNPDFKRILQRRSEKNEPARKDE
jgi:predicted regulator of amino acid metabolism with ACT domain